MGQGPDQSRAMSGGASGPMSGEPETERGDAAMLGRLVSGKYTIEKFLGGGAMGAVYKARFAALEKNVAVKVMHRSVATDANFVGRFHREAKAASRLDHPNSIRVIDFGEEPDGLLYIAMEYVEGRDLYLVIHEDWPISNADIGDIVMQALAAIAVAHEMGVIHRDLKPENLMMLRGKNDDEKDSYIVKVCDFGIAKITEKDDEPKPQGPAGQKLTTQGLVVGTPEYMSPEQARGEKLDARSDIYSMGVILYQLLTGRTPFTADTPLAVVLKHITEVPQPPSVHYAGVHKGLEAVTLKAMAKDRNERFQSARAMRNAIREALDGRPAPVDIAAATLEAPNTQVPGTAPMVVAAGIAPLAAPGVTASPGPALESAPTVAHGIAASSLTPLGTLPGPPERKKSRAGLVLGVAVVALLGAGGFVARKKLFAGSQSPPDDKPSMTALPPGPANLTAPPEVPSSLAAPMPKATTNEPAPSSSVADPHGPKHAPTSTAHGIVKAAPEAPVGVAVPPVPVAVTPVPPVPEPPPVPTVAPPPPVVPAAPAFNPRTCRAAAGQVRSSGATNAKDLTMNGTAGAWTTCAQSAVRERPSAPISASVHLAFSDTGSFRGASCAACPAPLAQCIASSTGRTVALKLKGGDVTGDPAFEVPITVTCD